jgi:hypothetical protein
MTCEWEQKWIKFTYKAQIVRLTGLAPNPSQEIQPVSIEQLTKSFQGNDGG